MRSERCASAARIALALILIGSTAAFADAPQQTAQLAPKRWSTIEIVTNDFDSVDPLRKATGIPLGALLSVNDPRVQHACDRVRRQVPGKVVHCRQFVGPEVDAEYLVEIEDGTPADLPPAHCLPTQLATDLTSLVAEWGKIPDTSTPTDDGPPERINADRYLDYNTPERHRQAQRIHSVVRTRIGELEKDSNSCSAQSRADAIGLMNYTGSPQRAIKIASAHMGDPDLLVRDVAVRLLGMFNRFISGSEVKAIVRGACPMTFGGFADRNKSIILLNRMQRAGLIRFKALGSKCQAQIRAIARTSNAVQTGKPAQHLIEPATADAGK